MNIKIGEYLIGPGLPCFIVAEIGINHNGDLALGEEQIAAAAESGANGVKFQNYVTEDFLSPQTILTHSYFSQGKRVEESQYQMFKRCELNFEKLARFKEICDKYKVVFHSTPTGRSGIDDLKRLGTVVLKNGSDYLTHPDIVRWMAETKIPTVLSTGMSYLSEVEEAVSAFRAAGGSELILLHCTSSYPTPAEEVNLRRLPRLAEAFQCPVGLSDHTESEIAALGAVALGASWVEKHFTSDKKLPGPDHSFSCDPIEFSHLVRSIRQLEASLGRSEWEPTSSEKKTLKKFKLSCSAAKDLPEGHRLEFSDIQFRRPGDGIPPRMRESVVGKRLKGAIRAGDVFYFENLE